MCCKGKFALDVTWTRNARGNQLVYEMRPLVLIGLVNKILALVVLTSKIKFTLLQKVVNAVLLSLSHRIKYWRLSIIVHMVGVASFFNQHLHDVSVSLSGRVEDRRLPITIDVIRFATILQEEMAEFFSAVSRDIEEASLIQGVLQRGVALSLFDEIFRHFVGLFVILDQATCE